MGKKEWLLLFLVMHVLTGFSQTTKQQEHLEQIWIGYFNQTRISNKWGIWADAHLRTKNDFTGELSQAIGRIGLTWYLSNNTRLTAGYAFINHFPSDNHKTISQPEHRPWQQIQWHTKYPKITTMQSLRLEERFRHKILDDSTLADGYSFNFKFRYNFLLQVPLSKKAMVANTFSFIVNDEVHINAGKQVTYNYFDQNRFFVGFGYQTGAHQNLQFGYLYVVQQLSSGSRFRNIHAVRIFYFQNIDLRGTSSH